MQERGTTPFAPSDESTSIAIAMQHACNVRSTPSPGSILTTSRHRPSLAKQVACKTGTVYYNTVVNPAHRLCDIFDAQAGALFYITNSQQCGWAPPPPE